MLGVGIGAIIIAPIVYGILSFVGGIIYGLVYNLAAGVVGGVELELEDLETSYTPPPQQPWGANQY